MLSGYFSSSITNSGIGVHTFYKSVKSLFTHSSIELKICYLIDLNFLSLIHTVDLDLLIGTRMQIKSITVVYGKSSVLVDGVFMVLRSTPVCAWL